MAIAPKEAEKIARAYCGWRGVAVNYMAARQWQEFCAPFAEIDLEADPRERDEAIEHEYRRLLAWIERLESEVLAYETMRKRAQSLADDAALTGGLGNAEAAREALTAGRFGWPEDGARWKEAFG